MADVAHRIAETRERIEPDFTFDREERVRHALKRRLGRQKRQRTLLMLTAAAAAAVLALFILLRPAPAPTVVRVVEPRPAALVELQDGSAVTARSQDARVEAVEVGAHAVTLKLEAGAARFSVTPNASRPFRVLAKDVAVTVLGTVFTVALEPNGVRVAVERGHVRVSNSVETRELRVGETAVFASGTGVTPAEVASQAPVIPLDLDALPSLPRPSNAGSSSWRALAEEGNYSAALARLGAEGSGAVRDTPEDLLLAADVARLGGRPDRAVASLQRVISLHPFDSRAPLAAFTLGRTLLEQLGRPREAAQAFSTARRLDRAGTLTQDALAREVESWSRAGEAQLAGERAREYLKLYPQGRRISAVKRLGGIE
jgi:transmembrane sensor